MPSAMPEIVPGGDFGANIDRLFTERSMVMQAWGAYGVLWPVIHQWLGVSPNLGRGPRRGGSAAAGSTSTTDWSGVVGAAACSPVPGPKGRVQTTSAPRRMT